MIAGVQWFGVAGALRLERRARPARKGAPSIMTADIIAVHQFIEAAEEEEALTAFAEEMLEAYPGWAVVSCVAEPLAKVPE